MFNIFLCGLLCKINIICSRLFYESLMVIFTVVAKPASRTCFTHCFSKYTFLIAVKQFAL